MANVKEYIARPIMVQCTKVMYCAHDENEHHVTYNHETKQWDVINADGLLCSSAHLQNALGIMWAQTTIDSKDWTILGD